MFTAVIPTLNRPIELGNAVTSILNQTYLPDELLIVDQSLDDKSFIQVQSLVSGYENIKLNYIHDSSISGLVAAKRVAANCAEGDIVCFLEDDIVLENDFIEQILQGFTEQPDMIGCCGIVTNMPSQISIHKFMFNLFHRGIYRDKRGGNYGEIEGRGHDLVASNMLSGGLSAWRREVFEEVPFDPTNGFFMLEDVDFSTRVAKCFGLRLYINPNARLEHHCSPINREAIASRHQRKVIEFIKFYKNRCNWSGATVSLLWLLLGVFFESIFKSISACTLWPLKGYFLGMFYGFKS
jgi:GT2 family glycosyltransferase